MGYKRTHSFQKKSSHTPQPMTQFRTRPFVAPVKMKPKGQPTPEKSENEAFNQHKFEAFGLQLKEECGTITPVEQERLGVLQAKMDDFWAQRQERASRFGFDISEVSFTPREGQAAPQLQPMWRQGTPGVPMKGQRSPLNPPQQSLASPIQAKLTIGEPGDKYEQEADWVASQVVEQIHAPATAQSTQRQLVQRQEEKLEELQAKSILQRWGSIGGGDASTDLDTAINSARGGGQPLDVGLQRSMGQVMGADFSGVRVHTDATSDELNQSIQAKAFTTGQDVFFRQGAYEPGSRGGQELIAHELTHVVQQNGGAVRQMQLQRHQGQESEEHKENKTGLWDNLKAGIGNFSDIKTDVVQLFTAPPAAPPVAGVRNGNLNGNGVPDESNITTRHGQPNDLVGTVPGVNINGWPYIQGVNATGTWVRFHLVNQQIGGLGNQDNLVPTSQATNHNATWRNFERTCQHHVGQQTSVHVTVDVQYPPINAGAGVGTVAANQHFYPTQISGRCYLWDAVANAYVLNANGAPANRRTFDVQIVPFPLIPPANAIQTDLRQQTPGWLRNTLMGSRINQNEAIQLSQALQPGGQIDDYINDSGEPTVESQLLDALDTFLAVDLQRGAVPQQGRIHIINGVYHI